MFELIEKLRAKPERVKKQIAFSVAFFLVGIIFVVWLGVIFPNWRGEQTKQDNVAKLEPSPISSFRETLSSSFKTLGSEFSRLKAAVSSFSTSPEHYSATSTNAVGTSTSE